MRQIVIKLLKNKTLPRTLQSQFLRLLDLKEGQSPMSADFLFTTYIIYFGSTLYDFYHISRYQKRERGKTVRTYSSQDLEGILVSSNAAFLFLVSCKKHIGRAYCCIYVIVEIEMVAFQYLFITTTSLLLFIFSFLMSSC